MAPHEPMQLRGCSGACQQGRIECPHPDACEIPAEEQDGPPLDRAGAFLLVMSIIGAWVAVLGIVQVSRWLYALVSGV
jgi:hypothetical protein